MRFVLKYFLLSLTDRFIDSATNKKCTHYSTEFVERKTGENKKTKKTIAVQVLKYGKSCFSFFPYVYFSLSVN